MELEVNNLLFIALSLVLTIGFWWNYNKNHFNASLIFVILLGLVLRVFCSLDPFLHEWDERFHALVAKNLMEHPLKPTLYDISWMPTGNTWTNSHVWLHKLPVPLWLISLSYSFFGVSDFTTRIPSILMSTTAIYFVYAIGRQLWNSKTGLIASFLFAVNGLVIELTAGRVATDHIDICFMFFILLAAYLSICFIRNSSIGFPILIGLCLGLAILSKWLPALIVIPFYILLHFPKLSISKLIIHTSLILFFAILLVIPWQWHIVSNFPVETSLEQGHQWAHIFEVLDNQGGEWYYFLNKIRINYGELIYLPLICFFIFYKKWRNHVWLAFATIIFVPLIFFSSVATKMQGYILYIAPFLFLVSAWFISFLKEFKWSKNLSNISTVALIVFSLIAVRYGLERVKPTEQFDIPQWKADILDIKEKYGNNSVAVFNSKRPVETMFYTSYLAFSRKPSKSDLEILHSKNFKVVVLND